MNSIQIDCFLNAAKYRSFSVAASRLFLSQSTLSRNISMLEKELDVTLFLRSSFRGIELTEAGVILRDVFAENRSRLESALKKAHDVESGELLHLTLGLLDGQLLDDRLSDVITAFRLEYPNVKIHIRRASYKSLMEGLEAEDISVVCMPAWQFPRRPDLQIQKICMIESILVIPKKLIPNIENRICTLSEFASLPFLSLDESESRHHHEMMVHLFQQNGLCPKIICCSTIREQIQAVEMGEGCIIINPYNAICYSPTVNCVHVKELEPQPFAVAWKIRSSSESVRCFHNFAQHYSNTDRSGPGFP